MDVGGTNLVSPFAVRALNGGEESFSSPEPPGYNLSPAAVSAQSGVLRGLTSKSPPSGGSPGLAQAALPGSKLHGDAPVFFPRSQDCSQSPAVVSAQSSSLQGLSSNPPSGGGYHHGARPLSPVCPLSPLSHSVSQRCIRELALSKPAVGKCKSSWLAALDSLMARGADPNWVREARDYIVNGVSLELSSTPLPVAYPNSKSVDKHFSVCKERLKVYQDLGAVALCGKPSLVHPLLAIEKEGRKVRLCLDLSRNLNEKIVKRRFKLQSLREAVLLSTPGCYYAKMDLSACFLSFPLSPASADMCGFSFGGKNFKFTGVPFGLSSAPRIVSLLLDVVSSVLIDKGVVHVRYLDDFLFIGSSAGQVRAAMCVAAKVFKDFGIVNNLEKCEGPLQRLEFLGILIDSLAQNLSVPEHKLRALRAALADVLSARSVSSRRLHSILGTLSHLSMVLPAARPFLRGVIDDLRYRDVNNLRGPRRLSAATREEMSFWLNHVSKWNGSQKWVSSSAPVVMASDASTEGFGWVMESAPPAVISRLPPGLRPGCAFAGSWATEVRDLQSSSKHIAWGELFSPVRAVQLMGSALSGAHVVFVLDNKTDVDIINRRKTRSPRLLALLRELCVASLKFGFSFTAIHRPGALNILPDVLSRPISYAIGSLDLVRQAVISSIARGDIPKSTAKPPKHFSYGAFFLMDFVSTVAASSPLLFPLSLSFCDSSTVSSQEFNAKLWGKKLGA